MKSKVRFVVFAVPLSGNKGSVSMLLGLMDAFESEQISAHFDVFSYYSGKDRERAGSFSNLEIHPGHPRDLVFGLIPMLILSRLKCQVPPNWERALQALKDCDAILAMGGTTFSDEAAWKAPWNAMPALIAAFLGRKPLVFMPQTIGPIRKKANRLLARWALGSATYVYGRDKASVSWVRGLGIERTSYLPDLSFLMKSPDMADTSKQEPVFQHLSRILSRKPAARCVGIVPNSIVYEKAKRAGFDYIGFLSRVVAALDEMGYETFLIPHSYRPGAGSMHNNDHPLCLAILRETKGSRVFYVDEDLDSRTLRLLIERMHLLITSRFHAMIGALAAGVPPLVLGWGEHKYLAVLKEYGLEHFYYPVSAIDFGGFMKSFHSAAEHREQLSLRIRGISKTAAHSGAEITDRLLKILGGPERKETAETLFHP